MPNPPHEQPPRLLVIELWGLGDLTLAMPFLRRAADAADVTLLARPAAAPLLARFAPAVELIPFDAPWTVFRGKYRLHAWPWDKLTRLLRTLRRRRFDLGVSVRRDPRDHVLLALAGARRRLGFPRAGSGPLLTDRLPSPPDPHRAAAWDALAAALELPASPTPNVRRTGRKIVVHTDAAQPTRRWPRERFDEIIARLRASGWNVLILDGTRREMPAFLDELAAADRFFGNDSGPGHLAALLGVPTFTIFGPQQPELFAPRHPQSAWIEGAPCPHKPCYDSCRFAAPFCIRDISTETVWRRLQPWLATPGAFASASGQ